MARGAEYIPSSRKSNAERFIIGLAVTATVLPVTATPFAVGAMIDTRSRSPFYTQPRGTGTVRKFITIADPTGTNSQFTFGTNDPRASRYGNFLRATAIDEIPQLWSVLMGDMMLYGVRDMVEADRERLAQADPVLYGDFEQAVKESRVKPSLFSPSSAWRKSIRYDATDPDTLKAVDLMSMELDLNYLTRDASLRTDLRAIARLPLQMATGMVAGNAWEGLVEERAELPLAPSLPALPAPATT